MTESSASPVLETEKAISDKSLPKVLIQQPSEADNSSEENNATVTDNESGAAVNGLPENGPQNDAASVKSEESQDKVDSNETGAELKCVEGERMNLAYYSSASIIPYVKNLPANP